MPPESLPPVRPLRETQEQRAINGQDLADLPTFGVHAHARAHAHARVLVRARASVRVRVRARAPWGGGGEHNISQKQSEDSAEFQTFRVHGRAARGLSVRGHDLDRFDGRGLACVRGSDPGCACAASCHP